MSNLLQKLTGRSEQSKTQLPALSEEDLNRIVETVTEALESKLQRQQAHFIEENIQAINKRLNQWTVYAQNDLFTLRRYLSDSTEKMQAQIDQIASLVEEMMSGKGEPNKDLLALAARVQDLESLCQSHSQKISALQLKSSGQSSKR